jgi:hypothetical protein
LLCAASKSNEARTIRGDDLSKAKGGTGRGTGKKGWNRWQAAANRAKNVPKPYKSKGTKNKDSSEESSPVKDGKSSVKHIKN